MDIAQQAINVSKVSSGWNGEYLPGVNVTASVELCRDDLVDILRALGLETAKLTPALAYRFLRIESERRLLDALREQHGQEPEDAKLDRRELERDWAQLLQEIKRSAMPRSKNKHTR